MRRLHGSVIGALLLSGCVTAANFPPSRVWGFNVTDPVIYGSFITWALTEMNCQQGLVYAKRAEAERVRGTNQRPDSLGPCRLLTLSSDGEMWGYAYSGSQNYGTDYGKVFRQKALCESSWIAWAGVQRLTDCTPVTIK